MQNLFDPKPRLGISACLLGQRVRYDGGHKRDVFLTEVLQPFVEWVPVCPELEAGMGVPRESVRLIGPASRPRMIAERSGRDWTETMKEFAQRRSAELSRLGLCGYVFKKDSPSCGMERVRVYGTRGGASRDGTGLFARTIMEELSLMPVEEEGRLNDPALRENFIERVFAYRSWLALSGGPKSVRALVEFHTGYKLKLLAHSESHYRALGRAVAGAKQLPLSAVYERYGCGLMHALRIPASAKKHANVLDHMMGYFSAALTSAEREELVETIRDYRLRLLPLIVPITLIRHYVRKYHVAYLQHQVYLAPSPKELMLHNHV
jgi:uncharacterized protein YbgA (DUF1722 family)/uncharacterized protein YbbK (DUF523 family)